MVPVRADILPTVPSLPMPIGSNDPPPFCRNLFLKWPNKSELVGEVASTLSQETQASFLSLSPPDAGNMVFCLLVASPEDPVARESMLRMWMERLSKLRQNSSTTPSIPPLPRSSASVGVNLQFVVAGIPSVVGAVVLGIVQKILPRLHRNISWSFAPAVFIKGEVDDGFDGEDIFNRVGVQFNHEIRTFQTFGQNIEGMWTEWQKNNTRFVLVTSIGMDACANVSKGPLASSHLHEAGLRYVWGMVGLSEALRKRGQDDHVAEIVFAPGSTEADWATTLSRLWGQPCTPNTSEDSGRDVLPKPCTYATPGDFKVVSLCENQAGAEACVDGWTGPCPRAVAALAENGGPLPDALGQLAVINLFKERPLTAQETHALSTFSMKHGSGERRLCSRPFWLRLYGLLNTPGEAALIDSSPCASMIVATTGLAAPAGLSSLMTVPCGKERYCRTCEKFLALLSTCYGTCDIVDTLAALITRCINTWGGTGSNSDLPSWTRSGATERMHNCGDHCPHRR